MPPKKNQHPIQQTAIGDGIVQIAGDNNTVNQTIIQKFFNIFKSDAETVDQHNRRIMLGHVENFWVKGILEKSLHGAALLDLGIKEDPDALNYPWAIKREANKETLPAGTSMLEIFQEIGLGRSLLILGAPGSGKTTMLLELTLCWLLGSSVRFFGVFGWNFARRFLLTVQGSSVEGFCPFDCSRKIMRVKSHDNPLLPLNSRRMSQVASTGRS